VGGHVRPNPAEEVRERQRLRQILDRAESERCDAVALLCAGGEDDDRHVGPARLQLSQDVEAVDVREAQIQDDEVELGALLPARPLERLGAGLGALHVVALAP
jgi:hypothetical protein